MRLKFHLRSYHPEHALSRLISEATQGWTVILRRETGVSPGTCPNLYPKLLPILNPLQSHLINKRPFFIALATMEYLNGPSRSPGTTVMMSILILDSFCLTMQK